MAEVIIFGTERFGEIACYYLTRDSKHKVVAFTVDGAYMKEKRFNGLPIIPFEEIGKHYPPDDFYMLIAIGYSKLNSVRAKKYLEAKKNGYRLINYVCSKSTIWGDVEVGDNSFIFENQVIQPFTKIGNDVILWSGNHLGHDVIIGDHTWVSSHVVISGGVKIGLRCFIGNNVTIRDGVTIGDESIIGQGVVILKNVKEKSVYIAQPTKPYRFNSEQFEKMMDISK